MGGTPEADRLVLGVDVARFGDDETTITGIHMSLFDRGEYLNRRKIYGAG